MPLISEFVSNSVPSFPSLILPSSLFSSKLFRYYISYALFTEHIFVTGCMCSMYVQNVCAECMCRMYVQHVCAECMCSMYVQNVCAACMCSIYVQHVCAAYTCSMYVQHIPAACMYSMYLTLHLLLFVLSCGLKTYCVLQPVQKPSTDYSCSKVFSYIQLITD